MKQTRSFCLASASPRRRALLRQFGFRFKVRPVSVDEKSMDGESPERLVARLAQCKAQEALHQIDSAASPPVLVIAADTIVVADGEVMGKPAGASDAARMLRRLSSRTHRVLSAYALMEGGGPSVQRTVETQVVFRELPDAWIAWYSGLPESRDKAGAYAIQGMGGAMVSHIEGSYQNVVGLPMERVVWDMIDMGWVIL